MQELRRTRKQTVFRRMAISHAHAALVQLERAGHLAEKSNPRDPGLVEQLNKALAALNAIPDLVELVRSLEELPVEH